MQSTFPVPSQSTHSSIFDILPSNAADASVRPTRSHPLGHAAPPTPVVLRLPLRYTVHMYACRYPSIQIQLFYMHFKLISNISSARWHWPRHLIVKRFFSSVCDPVYRINCANLIRNYSEGERLSANGVVWNLNGRSKQRVEAHWRLAHTHAHTYVRVRV